MYRRYRIVTNVTVLIIILISLAVSPASAEVIQHPYVLIPYEGELIQDTKLTKDEWEAIILAVNHSIDRINAAVVAVDRKNYSEAQSIIKSALHLLVLVKIATPSFEIAVPAQSDQPINKLQSLLIKIKNQKGGVRIIDLLLMKANLENALISIKEMDTDFVRLFLENAIQSSWRYE